MTDIAVDTLFTPETAENFYSRCVQLGAALGLDTTSWRQGDPTLVQFQNQSKELETLHAIAVEFFKGGFLSSANAEWLKLLATDVYGVTPIEGAPSTPTITIINSSGATYDPDPGDWSFKASASNKSFRTTSKAKTTAGVESPLTPGATRVFDLVADEDGQDTTVAANDVDEFITSVLGVAIVSSTAATGTDEEGPLALITRCLATLGALSPDGPADAYEYVALTPELSLTTAVTRAHTIADNDQGLVTLYVAGATGALGGGIVALVQTAIEIWATPLCITPTAISATGVTINVDADVTGDDIPADFEATITAALQQFFAVLQIGTDVYRSAIIAVIHTAVPELESVTLITPAADTAIAESQVPVLGTVNVDEV